MDSLSHLTNVEILRLLKKWRGEAKNQLAGIKRKFNLRNAPINKLESEQESCVSRLDYLDAQIWRIENRQAQGK